MWIVPAPCCAASSCYLFCSSPLSLPAGAVLAAGAVGVQQVSCTGNVELDEDFSVLGPGSHSHRAGEGPGSWKSAQRVGCE